MNPLVSQLTDFIRSIGIEVSFEPLSESGFLPGISIRDGVIIVDNEALLYPGDLLHEAGHIAVVPRAERGTLSPETIGTRPLQAAEEMMAIAWSYAACTQLGLDPAVVFHAGGYMGGGDSILSTFSSPTPIGVPMLQYIGLTCYGSRAAEQGTPPFPAMQQWTLN
jgi:hypothetical protein